MTAKIKGPCFGTCDRLHGNAEAVVNLGPASALTIASQHHEHPEEVPTCLSNSYTKGVQIHDQPLLVWIVA